MKNTHKDTYKAIFEACEEGIVVVCNKGIIVMANKASHHLFGYEEGELIGLSVDNLVPHGGRSEHVKYRKEYEKHPTPRQMGKGRDLLGIKKNGQSFPVEISLNQAEIDGVMHSLAFAIDITERKKIEEALKKSEEQLIIYAAELEKRVNLRTQELDQTIHKLEEVNADLEEQIGITKKAEDEARIALGRERELNELKSRFVSMASHEFRTPLSTILSSASLIERYTAPGTEEKRQRHVQKIKSSISNLTAILNDFLSLSKLEEGKVELLKSQINLPELMADIIDELTPLAKEGQFITLNASPESFVIESDSKILKNISFNLISNAIKYSEPNTEINIDLKKGKGLIHISVTDHGIGIPEEEQRHMFERFFRAKNATNIQGTGLGLNIVKKYVDMLEGSIDFNSELNIGTTFTITLPY